MTIPATPWLCTLALSLTTLCPALADTPPSAAQSDDPHYVAPGFFDLHVCHWPERPLFFMAVFSTVQFAEVAAVEVFDPKNKFLGTLDLKRYKTAKHRQGQEKRIFISHFDVAPDAVDGWYSAQIRLRNGAVFSARDLVRIRRLDLPGDFQPADHAQLDAIPGELRWNAIPGARFYQVILRDAWADAQLFKSPLLTEPRAVLPPGLLRRGGSYTWRVHARDVNEDRDLGDFNHGTLGPRLHFDIAP